MAVEYRRLYRSTVVQYSLVAQYSLAEHLPARWDKYRGKNKKLIDSPNFKSYPLIGYYV